jgi:hypothetical protein
MDANHSAVFASDGAALRYVLIGRRTAAMNWVANQNLNARNWVLIDADADLQIYVRESANQMERPPGPQTRFIIAGNDFYECARSAARLNLSIRDWVYQRSDAQARVFVLEEPSVSRRRPV